ncbi:MAG: 1-deoxy-D-xylulose 5-phosphate reductoisomerase [Firmicutes bacterium ADurb.Bin193]|nr:MAG: 1-deoxy-D-xylulose 5-phosphate reductoisomerase [Firmicutes bacterium ADurb.Bin193]
MKKISILGSTGSVGTQALETVDFLGNVRVTGLCANSNTKLLERQIRKYRPAVAAVKDEKAALALKAAVADTATKVVGGEDGICQAACADGAEAVLTSVVGISGLAPTLAAIESGRDIFLANKETLVAAGELVMKSASRKGVKIIPVDSEHSAVFQCINGQAGSVKRIILTASGGAFFGRTKSELENVTVAEAISHPNWSMGKKITVDSSTLMNKGLEVIEAHHLFGVPYDDIEVVIHRESIIHSMVEFTDNSILAQMGLPDMRLPIHYAICYPERVPSAVQRLDFKALTSLTFFQPDVKTFPLLALAQKAGRLGGTAPTALNSANEAAVALFLSGKIRFLEIAEIVEKALSSHKPIINPSLKDIIETDRNIRCEILKEESK